MRYFYTIAITCTFFLSLIAFAHAQTPKSLIIQRASYGSTEGAVGADVTQVLAKLVVDNCLTIEITNDELGGDPAVGRPKRLHVEYTLGGKEYAQNIPEGGLLTIPEIASQAPTYLYYQNGDGNWQTVVASAVVTKRPYNADPTGKTDATKAIQTALDVVGNENGGVVYLPKGTYLIGGHLTIRPDVTLMGAYLKGAGINGNGFATQINATGGAGTTDPNAPALITAGGVWDLSIYYPNQTPTNPPVPYPYTISGGLISNVMLYNSYDAVRTPVMNCSLFSRIRGTALHTGLVEGESSEIADMDNVCFANRYWVDNSQALSGSPMTSAQSSAIESYTKANLIGMKMQRVDGIGITGFSAPDARVQVWLTPSPKYDNGANGFGACVQGFPATDQRQEDSWVPWYYNMRYIDVDNCDWSGGLYQFATSPIPAKPVNFIDVASLGAIGNGNAAIDTQALQKALREAGSAGGGTVYLPQGKYFICEPIIIPSGVELRGPLAFCKRRQFTDSCTLCCDYAWDATSKPFVSLSAHSGIRAVAIYYARQNYPTKDQKEWTPLVYPPAIMGMGSGVWIVDTNVLGAYYGVDLASHQCDNHIVKNFAGTVLNTGINVGGNSTGGILERIFFTIGYFSDGCPDLPTGTSKALLWDRIQNHDTLFEFGTCSNETCYSIGGFNPLNAYWFYDDGGTGMTNSNIYMSSTDIPWQYGLKVDKCGSVNFIGYASTGWSNYPENNGKLNWLEFGKGGKGTLNFYARSIQPTFINHPWKFEPGQNVTFHDERTLATGAAVVGSSGTNPSYATDLNEQTCWDDLANMAPFRNNSQDYILLDLGAVHTITGVGYESAGLFIGDLTLNTGFATVYATDITPFSWANSKYLATVGNETGKATNISWADCPLKVSGRARYIVFYPAAGSDGHIHLATVKVYGY